MKTKCDWMVYKEENNYTVRVLCGTELVIIEAYEPYWDKHLMCPYCDGTYCFDE